MADLDVTVIGGGIVGCAVAARAVQSGLATVLIERSPLLGSGTTSRNSEVVHGGTYYPPGSLKAEFCVAGRRRLKTFCEEAGVRYRECGKLIVAVTADEIPRLEELLARGQANGVEDLALLDGQELASLEPGPDGWTVEVEPPAAGGREGWTHTSRWVVNAAGLYADRVAELAGIDADARDWRLRWVKGSYFAISPRHDGRVNRLVYPVPPADGSSLGVHLCVDLAGRMRLGPDVEPLPPRAGEDYTVDPARAEAFFAGARRFLPFLALEDLTPDICGLRPRRAAWWRDGFADFVVAREEGDLAGLINLVGIESPGLTSAPAIADRVGEWLLA